MLLFRKPFHAGLVDGSIRLTFRSWDKPHVRAGGRYRCHPIGVLQVDRIERVRVADITEDDARLCGFATLAELREFMNTEREEVFRIELHHGGDGDRVDIALDDRLSEQDLETLRAKLERMGDWTYQTMKLIEKHPRVAASQLALKLGRDRDELKIDIRKLKKLGLTQSFEVGYELSPRGKAFMAVTSRKSRSPKKAAPAARRAKRSSRR